MPYICIKIYIKCNGSAKVLRRINDEKIKYGK